MSVCSLPILPLHLCCKYYHNTKVHETREHAGPIQLLQSINYSRDAFYPHSSLFKYTYYIAICLCIVGNLYNLYYSTDDSSQGCSTHLDWQAGSRPQGFSQDRRWIISGGSSVDHCKPPFALPLKVVTSGGFNKEILWH